MKKLILIHSFIFIVCFIFFGCDNETLIEPNEIDLSQNLIAVDFPTADGTEWTYISSDETHSYTVKISETRNIGGYVARTMEIDSEIPVDFTGSVYGFPVRKIYFTKDADSYNEYAFELWLDFVDDTYFQRYLPKRITWSFPIYESKEWQVTKLYTFPGLTYTRKVISGNNIVSVRAGRFENVFYIEEYVSTEIDTEEQLIAKYWITANIGIIKYQYLDTQDGSIKEYELLKFKSAKE